MSDAATVQQKKQQAMQLHAEGELAAALAAFRDLCEIDPADARSWHMAGAICGLLGRFGEAERYCRQALKLSPGTVAVRVNLANALQALGRHDEAIQHLEKARALDPEDASACTSLGNLKLRAGLHDEAQLLYEQALATDPDQACALNSLGILMRGKGNLPAALKHFRQALEKDPEYTDAWVNTGLALLDSLNTGQAARCFRQALAIDPGHPAALTAMAGLHERQGRYAEAHALIRPLLGSTAVDVEAAILYSRLCRQLSEEQAALQLLRRLEGSHLTGRQQKVNLYFATGKLLDAMGQYDEAFEKFDTGNRLAGRRFDLSWHTQLAARLDRTFTRELLARAPTSRPGSEKLVFIVAMPRAGTSLAEQIIASHPKAQALGELNLLPRLVDGLRKALGVDAPEYPECIERADDSLLETLAVRHLALLDKLLPGRGRFVGKMPFTHYYLGLIELLFPNARIIHCTRHPLDVGLSCYFQQFAGDHSYTYDLGNLGRMYCVYDTVVREHLRRTRLPVLEVPYERMVSDHEETVRSMIDFLGLEWAPECLQYHVSNRHVETSSYNQVRMPIYMESVNRWKNYTAHLAPLRAALDTCLGRELLLE